MPLSCRKVNLKKALVKQCLRAWEKAGATPVTRKCLESDKEHREFGDKEDEMDEMMKKIQEQNDKCTFSLTHHGYDGSVLASKLNKQKVTAPVTRPNSSECIEVLARARTHGSLFHATGGGHITHNDFFKHGNNSA